MDNPVYRWQVEYPIFSCCQLSCYTLSMLNRSGLTSFLPVLKCFGAIPCLAREPRGATMASVIECLKPGAPVIVAHFDSDALSKALHEKEHAVLEVHASRKPFMPPAGLRVQHAKASLLDCGVMLRYVSPKATLVLALDKALVGQPLTRLLSDFLEKSDARSVLIVYPGFLPPFRLPRYLRWYRKACFNHNGCRSSLWELRLGKAHG